MRKVEDLARSELEKKSVLLTSGLVNDIHDAFELNPLPVFEALEQPLKDASALIVSARV